MAKFFQHRTVHRTLSILVALFTLYLGTTGSLIEWIDFRSIIANPSPFDPNLMAMREDFAGPPNFRVLGTADHLARPLPVDTNFDALLATVIRSTRDALGDAPLKFVELRMASGRPVGQIRTGKTEFRIDATTGAALGAPPADLNEDQPPASLRNTIKHLHRMTTFGNWALWINIIVSLALATLIVTGVVVYTRIWLARRRLRRTNPFWMAGGTWRSLHRSISIAAAAFLSIVALSGAWLAGESLAFGRYLSHSPGVIMLDASSPLRDSDLPDMLHATLAAYRSAHPGLPLRVVRLRHYGTMSQGIVITAGTIAQQLVFDTATGRQVRLTEPGYPETGFPFGWQAHQWAKSIHRGDFFGVTGRLMSLIAGLSLTYLSLSGIVMYWTMWSKRRRSGRKSPIWM